MSGYDIKKLVDVGLSHFWSENYGQIYPTLEQLVKNGLALKSKQRKSGKRDRFVYSITPIGKKLVRDWIRGPTDPPAVRNELQLKLFLSADSPTKSIHLIQQFQIQQRAQLEEYRNSGATVACRRGGRPGNRRTQRNFGDFGANDTSEKTTSPDVSPNSSARDKSD